MAKKKPKRMWIYAPKKPAPPPVPADLKAEVEATANALIAGFLEPTYVKPPPEDPRQNYLTAISTKWHRSFFYIIGHYASPSPDALSPTFELCSARMEYAGDGRFHLAYFRHTGKWWEIHRGLTVSESFEAIRDQGLLHPV